ncbi:MAG: transglycosylase domain-containing protein [Candidatus Zambryskibacteria bacterium]|nr:transglycosylase domain-containing protein [Candidatus Zambryskibacteria bacterium]
MAKKFHRSNYVLVIATLVLIVSGIFILWAASLRIPALEDISERKIDQSTKIYDRTGEILLYDLSRDKRRERVAVENMSPYAVAATVAIEDKNFYSHNGFQWTSFLRAILVNLSTLSFSQGGSTITQQVVKNSILTKDKTPTRKLKELILAIKLEKILTKNEILSLYLNEISYGGTIYGIGEAAQSFFGKQASDLTLAESAYLASLPKAPTYYSPYGPNISELEIRKNLVLHEMLIDNFISEMEYQKAVKEKVAFNPRLDTGGIKAPHFVFFVLDYLAKRYGEDALQNGDYKIVTTLDYSLQEKAETVSRKYGVINKEKFNGENNGMVAIDPKSGGILMMVGSRDYFDKEIDGNFNVTTGFRQPGSTFKPFIYATMFKKGYTDQTILYDTRIQFSPNCAPDNLTTDDICYAPNNYDDRFRGPMTVRNALAQSVNIPAVQGIYLAGISDSISTAKDMGIETLNEPERYGLSLVLGGGGVSLLDMTSAYSVFANDGVRNRYNPVLWVEDADGNVIDRYMQSPQRVLSEEVSRLVTDILADNAARTPGFGANSALYISTRPVAVKTGTSNDYRDAWIIGYTPNLTVGAWVGNNDNRPMEKKVSGLVVAPLWREYMEQILPQFPIETFIPPKPEDLTELKPVLRGDWTAGGLHSILYWVDKNNPRGPIPQDPTSDSQFKNWEYGVNLWTSLNHIDSPN